MKIIKTYKLGNKYFKKEFALSELENGEGKEYLKQLNEEYLAECEAIGEMVEEMREIMIKINEEEKKIEKINTRDINPIPIPVPDEILIRG